MTCCALAESSALLIFEENIPTLGPGEESDRLSGERQRRTLRASVDCLWNVEATFQRAGIFRHRNQLTASYEPFITAMRTRDGKLFSLNRIIIRYRLERHSASASPQRNSGAGIHSKTFPYSLLLRSLRRRQQSY